MVRSVALVEFLGLARAADQERDNSSGDKRVGDFTDL